MGKQRVLFLCTHNSARSQMAEGFLRTLAGDRYDVASAGSEQTRVHPLAIRAMAEAGVDISGHTSKTFDAFLSQPWDYVITVCDRANEHCPTFPARTTRLHWSFPDPSQAQGSEEGRLTTFRRVRDEIHTHLKQWVADREPQQENRVGTRLLMCAAPVVFGGGAMVMIASGVPVGTLWARSPELGSPWH